MNKNGFSSILLVFIILSIAVVFALFLPFNNDVSDPQINGNEMSHSESVDETNKDIRNSDIEISEESKSRDFNELVWEEYSNQNLGVSFLYPKNLNTSQCFAKNETSLLVSEETDYYKHRASVCHHMSYIVSVTNRGIINKDLDTWIEESGLLSGSKEKIVLNGKVGYYYEITAKQQVPSDVYIFEHHGDVLTIGIYKPEIRDEFEHKVIETIIRSVEFF